MLSTKQPTQQATGLETMRAIGLMPASGSDW